MRGIRESASGWARQVFVQPEGCPGKAKVRDYLDNKGGDQGRLFLINAACGCGTRLARVGATSEGPGQAS